MNNKILSVAIAATMLFTGCNNDNDPITDQLTDTPIKVTAGVNDIVAKAGHDNTTNKPIQFGVFVENAANATYTYKNIEMNSADAGTTWTPETMMLWENSSNAVNVLAYVPYNAAATNTKTLADQSIQTDQSTADNVKASDYLYYKSAESVTPSTAGIPIAFTHALSKLNLTITLGTEFNNQDGTQENPITEVKINGTKTSFEWALTTNVISPATTSTPITPFAGTYKAGVGINTAATNAIANYEAILVPQTVEGNGFSIEFEVNGKSYYWASPNAVTLTQHTAYTLALTVGKDIVTAGDFDITDWVSVTGGGIETE